jgi:hypothetical protein
MQTTPEIANFIIQENTPQKEIKPLKGANLDMDVQRFEQILFKDQYHKTNGIDPVENTGIQNPVSKLNESIFSKVGNFKKSIDQRIHNINQMVNKPGKLDAKDLLNMQWQISMYSLEATLAAKSGDKVSQGIQTLFRNQ